MLLPLDVIPIERTAETAGVAEVTIIGRGPSPGVGSGILMTTVLIIGGNETEGAKAYFIPFGVEHGLFPRVGAKCSLTYAPGQPDMVGGGMQLAPGVLYPVVSAFDCDATSPLTVGDEY